MPKLVMFGAGNIGRSFIAQLFSQAGFETVFIDIKEPIIEALNRFRSYRIEIRDRQPETIVVKNVRGVLAADGAKVAAEVADADIVATAVGPNSLPAVYPALAEGLILRKQKSHGKTLDIIICENLRNAAYIFRKELKELLKDDLNETSFPGLVETSIGKMVPLLTHEEETQDVLTVYAEAYNTLILDAKGFRGEIPHVPGLDPKQNMKAYVDRKLFIHNLGHSITAYVGCIVNKQYRYIWEAIDNPEIREMVRSSMQESAKALIAAYPDEFNPRSQKEHIEDLISRFSNKALGDTIYRVGRDLQRKLSPNERLVGSLRFKQKYGDSYSHSLLGIAAALLFRAEDEKGSLFPRDEEFVKKQYSLGVQKVLQKVSGFHPVNDKALLERIEYLHDCLIRFASSSSRSVHEIYNCLQ